MMFFKPVTRIAAACALIFSQSAQAATLQEVLRQSFGNDPELQEAQANRDAANTDIKIAKSGHLPTMTLSAAQVLAQSHRYESNARRRGINPGLQGRLNLYSFGGVDARVRHSEHKYDYFHHKYYETQETVGHTIGQLYLSALRAKENIIAAQSNLQRHDQIINDLQIIAKYDKGRQSELDQAVARRLRVHAYLADQTRSMELNLSRLGKYTQKRLNPAALTDPFVGENATSIVKRYQTMDLGQQPSYQAQQAERQSALAELDVNKSARYPSIDLMASASRDNKEIYLNLNWDFYSPSANYQVEKSAQTLVAAEAKSDQILRDVAERSRSSEVDMRQSLNRYHIAQQQIAAQKKVIKAYELQFKIARRTLIDVLDSYSDLWSIESEMIASQNDFRDAALEYLSSQSAIARFAGLIEDRSSPERKVRRSFREHLPDEFLPPKLQERFDKIDFNAIEKEVGHLGDQLNYLKNKTKEKLDKVLPDTPADANSNTVAPAAHQHVPNTAADYPVIVDNNTINDNSNQPYVPTSKAAAKAKVAAAKSARTTQKNKTTKNTNKNNTLTNYTQEPIPTFTPPSFTEPNHTTPNNTTSNQAQGNTLTEQQNSILIPDRQPETPKPTAEHRPTMSPAQTMPDKVLNYDDVMSEQPPVPTSSTLPQLNYDDVMSGSEKPNQTTETNTQQNDMERNPIKYITFRETPNTQIKHKKTTKSKPNENKTPSPSSKSTQKNGVSESQAVVDKTKQKTTPNSKNNVVSESKALVGKNKQKTPSTKNQVQNVPNESKPKAKVQAASTQIEPKNPPKVKLVESPEHGVILDKTPKSSRPSLKEKEKKHPELKSSQSKTTSNSLPNGFAFEARVPYDMSATLSGNLNTFNS